MEENLEAHANKSQEVGKDSAVTNTPDGIHSTNGSDKSQAVVKDLVQTNKSDRTRSNDSDESKSQEVEEDTAQPRTSDGLHSSAAASNVTTENVHYEGSLAIYTDPSSGFQYQWSAEKNEWEPRDLQYGFEDDTHVYTDKDGTKFFWDKQKSAWFPKLDDDFMACYQMNYGFEDGQQSTTKAVESKTEETVLSPKKPKGEKRKASEPTWFEVDDSQNTKVYVSNLPNDLQEEEFIEFMQKCGLVMKDLVTSKFKVKLYKEPGTDYFKGDALCTYIKVESVELALKLLDGADFKGNRIKVEKARFEMRGEYDPKLKPKMRKRKEKLKLKRQQEKLFDWRPEKILGERMKHEKVVIIKNLFDPSIFDTDVGLILEFQQDLREECAKLGEVKKVTIYDRHPEGVAQINMATPEEADEVVKLLNGRWFMKRQLTAETWDGRTKYRVAETDAQISKRLDNWDKYLEGDTGNYQKTEENCNSKESELKGNKVKTDSDKNVENEDKKPDDIVKSGTK